MRGSRRAVTIDPTPKQARANATSLSGRPSRPRTMTTVLMISISASRCTRQVAGEKPLEARGREIDAHAACGLVEDASGALGWCRLWKARREHEGGGGQEADHGQQRRREGRAQQALEIIGQSRERQRAGATFFLWEHVRNGRLKRWA